MSHSRASIERPKKAALMGKVTGWAMFAASSVFAISCTMASVYSPFSSSAEV